MSKNVRINQRKMIIWALLILIQVAGCGLRGNHTGFSPTNQPGLSSATDFQNPNGTPSVDAANSPTPALNSTQTLALTPTPAPHPMDIRALRTRAYPGSDIVVEQTLDPGDNYRRYYSSYLSEGLKIFALLTVPNGEMPPNGWPAIVFNHGYIPPAEYRTTERYVNYVDQLARNGYIVFRIDYRGHDRSEGAPSGAYGDPDYLVDVLNAVSSIQRFPQADADKIGIWGHSMGGFLALRAMVVTREIKAGVIWAGVVGSYPDMLNNWRRSSSSPLPTIQPGFRRWRQAWIEDFGTPEQNPEFWGLVSANTYLVDLSGPIQLHHGTADEEVPVEFSQTLFNQVQAAGGEAELYVYEGDNHNIANYFSTAMTRTVTFYDRFLK